MMKTRSEQSRRRAAALFAQARKREAQRDYRSARKCYEESLRLHEDSVVRAAYVGLLATIGPK